MESFYAITFTQSEATVLRALLNAAVMARGMETADAGLYFDRKVVNALSAPPQKPKAPKKPPPIILGATPPTKAPRASRGS